MTVEYSLWRSITALASDHTVVEIPAGAVLEAPATFAGTGTVKILYKADHMTVLAHDLILAGGVIREGDIE